MEVSEWGDMVRKNADAEQMRFPLDRQPKYGASIDTVTASKPRTPLELGIDALLKENQLDGERRVATMKPP